MKQQDMFDQRKPLDQICTVPENIVSVYSLEKHVWADFNSQKARRDRKPELETIEKFEIDPVRPFLNDIFRKIAAPYKPGKKGDPVGQGYWIQAEFGSGKSHVLSFLSALALGDEEAWKLVEAKEKKAGRGKRDSLHVFWEEGLESKSRKTNGIFVVVTTLVGAGGGAVGINDKGRRLSEYILDAAKSQIEIELGKNISLYPSELLADRFLKEDADRYRNDLKKFLKDPKYFEEDEIEDVNDFLRDIQQDKSPDYKQSCGNKLWRFYTEYLKVRPQIEAETEDILRHLVETVLREGYCGLLLVLDEVSLFMKNRDDNQRSDDEKTLVVLANRLAKVENLPVWTVCAAQQALESKMGVKNILADDRLKLVKLLENDKDYYDIVLSRVREIKDPSAIDKYYLFYKRGFSWPNSIGQAEFSHFFPFHKPAIEVLKAITYELTTTRSAIHFMHQTLKFLIKNQGAHVVRLWELFDETVRYEEDPSGVSSGIAAIKSNRESDYRAYESCKSQIEAMTKGLLKVHRDKAVKIIQTLFLYFLAKTRQKGITPEEIANSVLLERDGESTVEENIQHYETIAEHLKRELHQIAVNPDEEGRHRYLFTPKFTGVDPRDEFQKAKDDAESNPMLLDAAWEQLLALDKWTVKTGRMNIDLSGGVRSIFHAFADRNGPAFETAPVVWQGRQIAGRVCMRDIGRIANDNLQLPPIASDETDLDFQVVVGRKPASEDHIEKILARCNDPRLVLWTPDEPTSEERIRLVEFAAYRKLINDWQGKESEDASAVVNWTADALRANLATVYRIVSASYARGRMDSRDHSQMAFKVAGELKNILTPVLDRVLSSCYASKDIRFDPPFEFRKEEGVKVINGIVRTGEIPKGAKPDQNISAARNFGFGLEIMKKSAERLLDVSDNPYVRDIWNFIDDKLADGDQSMKIATVYKNFMGVGGPKDYGLSRRMVEIYLLCLVKTGKIRMTVGPKSGLPDHVIDYANIASVEFSVKVLNALEEVRKVEKPENWDVLRPYAEKLLKRTIPENENDAAVTRYREELKKLFLLEKEVSARIEERAAAFFETVGAENPYRPELEQVARLFATNLESGNDIQLLLYALKEIFGCKAFDDNRADPAEADDLANRLKNYRDLKRFLEWEGVLKTGFRYCAIDIPESWLSKSALKPLKNSRKKFCAKLRNLQPFVDSEVKLKTELVGNYPPEKGDGDTLAGLVHEYTQIYRVLHDDVLETAEQARREIQGILRGKDLEAFKIVEGVSALRPPVSPEIEKKLQALESGVFSCPSPSKGSVEKQLRACPVHECGLTFENAGSVADKARKAAERAKKLFDEGVNGKMNVFLADSVRERLEQGKEEPVIAGILACENVESLRDVLFEACLKDPSAVDTINRYLKRISVIAVNLDDFTPGADTFEKERIAEVAEEFRLFLERSLLKAENEDDDVLRMIRLEKTAGKSRE